jgi:hypothetical protein
MRQIKVRSADVKARRYDLTARDVARIFHVSEWTVHDWSKRGLLISILTPGGQRRFNAGDIALAVEEGIEAAAWLADDDERPDQRDVRQ